jgi:pyruvate kinase
MSRMEIRRATRIATLQESMSEQRGRWAAVLVDTRGPEIRTKMLWDRKPINLEAGQAIIAEAVRAKYT